MFNSSGQKLSLFLVLQTIFYFIGIYIFTQGFLLNRLVVPQNSSCADNIQNSTAFFPHVVHIETCWRPARFKKAVLIVIDALRYDFMLYNETLASQEALSFQNKLGVIHEVLKTKPEYGQVFKFVADPPTTTMQRIKGLTTGSLPTFVDAGSNFASSEIHEDNIIAQLNTFGKKIVFMGDDTWMGLFPNSFERHYPFPSFNVKDLHTVDNGVISHLIPEIQREDWDVVIAHFLGVDHCGHRYGPYHPAMAEKLTQMDNILRSVINELDKDTILMVFGDHGMTRTGDHGGDSDDEVHAGLFVYSPSKIFSHNQIVDNVVSQTDIVPTLSLLLGLPIPFSNLGIVITSLFEESAHFPRNLSKVHALQLNARQVHRYLQEYSKLSNDISSDALQTITKLFFESEEGLKRNTEGGNFTNTTGNQILLQENGYLTFLKEIRELCRKVWARFDLTCILAGVVVVTMSCLTSLLLILPAQIDDVFPILLKGVMLTFILSFLLFFGYVWMLFLVLISSTIAAFVMKLHEVKIWEMKNSFAAINCGNFAVLLLFLLHIAGFFSNSFVVHEDKMLLFFLQTIFLVMAVSVLVKSIASSKSLEFADPINSFKAQKRKDKKKRGFVWSVFGEMKRELVCVVLMMVLTRLGQIFWPCREEQAGCEASKFLNASASSGQNGYQFWLSTLFILFVPVSLVLRLRAHGNLIGYSCTVLAVKYALPFGALFASVHWLLQYVPAKMLQENPGIGFIQQIITPCIVYSCCLGTLCCLLYQPITAFVVMPRDLQSEPAISTGQQSMRNAVVKIFKHLRSEMSEADKGGNIPHVYGLGTVYSSALLILSACLALPVALVLGDGLGPSVTLMIAQMYLFLEIYRMLTAREDVEMETSLGSLLFPVLTWTMLSSHNFFSSGHQATIPSIRFEAAFVGLPGDLDSVYLPGFLILLNTFASDVLFTIGLPLIVFWKKQIPSSRAAEDENRSHTGEFAYHENPSDLRSDLFRFCALYQVCKGFKLVGTMSAAAVHRRHLMVWKIFAPRFIFEGVSFIVTSVILVLVFWFVLRIDKVFRDWCLALGSRTNR